MKVARIAILLETVLIITGAVVARSFYSSTRNKIGEVSGTLESALKQNEELAAQYNDVNAMYEELRRQDVAETIGRHAEDVDPELPDDVIELKRMVSFERRQHGELEDAFERLTAELDAQTVPAEDARMRQPQRDPAPDLKKERDEEIDRWVGRLQRRIDTATDPTLQQRLAELGESIQTIRELDGGSGNSAAGGLADEFRRFTRLNQEVRRLELESLAGMFEIPADRTGEFARRVNQFSTNNDISDMVQVAMPPPR